MSEDVSFEELAMPGDDGGSRPSRIVSDSVEQLDLPSVCPSRSAIANDDVLKEVSWRPACDDADPAIVLKTFRSIGTANGVHLAGLLDAVLCLKNPDTRKKLKRLLPAEFEKYDTNGDGYIDMVEFELMVNSSLYLKSFVYEFTRAEDEKEHGPSLGHLLPNTLRNDLLESVSIILVLLNAVVAAVRSDNMPDWRGWDFLDAAFAGAFTIDAMTRLLLEKTGDKKLPDGTEGKNGITKDKTLQAVDSENSKGSKKGRSLSSVQLGKSRALEFQKSAGKWRLCGCVIFRKTRRFLSVKVNILDAVATLLAWLDVCFTFLVDEDRGSLFWIHWLRWVRLLRLLRLIARLGRLAAYLNDLAVLLRGVVEGARLACWGFVLIGAIMMLWGIFLRNLVEQDEENVNHVLLKEAFPNLLQTMNFIFRCMVVKPDGSCSIGSQGSFIHLLAGGWMFETFWSLTELFVMFVVLNTVSAIYVLQAADNAKHVQDSVFQHRWRQDEDKLVSLDTLLRSLIYPSRGKDRHPKERYAHQEALKLQVEFPEVAETIPNLEKELLELATEVQISREELTTVVNKYQSQELDQFRKLELTPCAKLYSFEGKETLFGASKDHNPVNHLGIERPPINAKEDPLLQGETELEKLTAQAADVQRYVKSMVLPKSDWASAVFAGSSGRDQWKKSNGVCDEALDPGPKDPERVKKKVQRYQGRFERNRDYSRLGLIYDTVEHLVRALPKFVEGIGDGIKLATIENRFVQPHPLGWRDINLLLKVSLPKSATVHIMEVQLMLRELKELRPINHKIYEHVRTIPDEVLTRIMDRLVTDTTLDLNLSKTEWSQCLNNREVKHLLDHFGIPINLRKRLFELIDIRDNGHVSSSELQELLRLNRFPAQNLEILACHLRVREVQRYERLKLKDEVSKSITKEICKFLSPAERQLSDGDAVPGMAASEYRKVATQYRTSAHSRQGLPLLGSACDSTASGNLDKLLNPANSDDLDGITIGSTSSHPIASEELPRALLPKHRLAM